MPDPKPSSLFHRQTRLPCPVCGQVSYSQSGIHPQCAARQDDQKRKERIKQKKQDETSSGSTTASGPSRWHKNCPRCQTPQHVRRKTCSCGHRLIKD